MLKNIFYKSSIYALLLLFSQFSFSQIIFEKHFSSGEGWTVKEIFSGYIICGSNGPSLLLIKTDNQGNQVWEKRFGVITGINPEHDGFDLLTMPDGGFILAGRGKPFNMNSFAYFIRTDSSGNQLWDLKVYSDIDSTHDDYYAYKIAMTSQGDIIAAGRFDDYGFNKDYTIIKFDTLGNLLNRKHINVGANEFLTDFIYTDSAYYFLGYLNSNGHSIFNVTKTDTSCNIISNKFYGSNQDIEIGYSFILDSSENIYVTGIANYSSASNYFLNKYNIQGDTLSNYNYPVSPSWQVIYANDMLNSNGKFFIAGYESGISPDAGLLICIDTNGTELFRNHFGGNDHDEFFGLTLTSDLKIVCIGQTSSFNPGREVYFVKIDPDILLSLPTIKQLIPFEIKCTENLIKINLNDKLLNGKFKVLLYDLPGSIAVESHSNSNYSALDISNLKSGLYILTLEFDNQKISRKVFINHY